MKQDGWEERLSEAHKLKLLEVLNRGDAVVTAKKLVIEAEEAWIATKQDFWEFDELLNGLHFGKLDIEEVRKKYWEEHKRLTSGISNPPPTKERLDSLQRRLKQVNSILDVLSENPNTQSGYNRV